MNTKEPKPLSLDAQAEIVTAVEYLPAKVMHNAHPWVARTSYEKTVVPAPLTKAQDWQARDVWSERVVVWSILAMMIGLGLACLLGRGAL